MIISFSESEMGHVTCPHEDALVITAEIDDYDVKKIFTDSGSSTDVPFLNDLRNMGKIKRDLKKMNSH